jgi:hypothetical protein
MFLVTSLIAGIQDFLCVQGHKPSQSWILRPPLLQHTECPSLRHGSVTALLCRCLHDGQPHFFQATLLHFIPRASARSLVEGLTSIKCCMCLACQLSDEGINAHNAVDPIVSQLATRKLDSLLADVWQHVKKRLHDHGGRILLDTYSQPGQFSLPLT